MMRRSMIFAFLGSEAEGITRGAANVPVLDA